MMVEWPLISEWVSGMIRPALLVLSLKRAVTLNGPVRALMTCLVLVILTVVSTFSGIPLTRFILLMTGTPSASWPRMSILLLSRRTVLAILSCLMMLPSVVVTWLQERASLVIMTQGMLGVVVLRLLTVMAALMLTLRLLGAVGPRLTTADLATTALATALTVMLLTMGVVLPTCMSLRLVAISFVLPRVIRRVRKTLMRPVLAFPTLAAGTAESVRKRSWLLLSLVSVILASVPLTLTLVTRFTRSTFRDGQASGGGRAFLGRRISFGGGGI